MKRNKILAAAIVATLTAPLQAIADTANVNVYGKFDLSYDIINTGTSGATSGTTSNRVSSNTSLFGLKGSQDLAEGLSGVWQVETTLNVGNGGSAGVGVGTRNTFAGLSSASAGTVVLGRYDTPYKISTRKLDVFADGIADNRSLLGGQSGASAASATASANPITFKTAGASFDGRQDQVLAYTSPKLADAFTAAIGYVNLNPANNVSTGAKANAWSLAGLYDAGGIYTSLAYESHNSLAAAFVPGSLAGASEKATRLGAGYTADAFAVGLVYEKTRDTLSATNGNLLGHNAAYLSGKFNVSSGNVIKAAYSTAGSTATASTGAKQFSVGYDHSLGKTSTVYALYTKLSNQSAAGYTLSNNSSVGGFSTSAGVGSSPTAIAVGVKHTF
jgi:predicted porin